MNYLPFSKHLHIILSFPNTFYTKLTPQGKMVNMPEITREVQLMMDPSLASQPEYQTPAEHHSFGAKDIQDLTWRDVLGAYSCTECGRCTASCPANQTGKKLSPRKIMMDTRDRAEEIGKIIDAKGSFEADGKSLLGDYITNEELLACNSCNACVEACPVGINPLDIIFQLKRYVVMEASAAPSQWNSMFTNVENNQTPWQFNPADRFNWANDIEIKEKAKK
jgi:heterodisulfide reductase subunit C